MSQESIKIQRAQLLAEKRRLLFQLEENERKRETLHELCTHPNQQTIKIKGIWIWEFRHICADCGREWNTVVKKNENSH